MLFVERSQPLLVFGTERRACADELAIAALNETARIRLQSDLFTGLVYRLNALKELSVQIDLIDVLGHPRGLVGLDPPEGRIRVRLCDLVEHTGNAPQNRPGPFERF